MKMTYLLIILLTIPSWVLAKVVFTPSNNCPPKCVSPITATGYNEHYAYQNRDGSIQYYIQDREYNSCSAKTIKQLNVTKEQWENTINEYKFEEVK